MRAGKRITWRMRRQTRCAARRAARYGPVMTADQFVPLDFEPPTSLETDRFRLEPLGPQHNEADLAAWTSSIEHIRSTPGYPRQLASAQRHDARGEPQRPSPPCRRLHAARRLTFTVLDPTDNDVIGCVYLYPTASEEWNVSVQSWVRADRSDSTYHSPTPSRAGSPATGPGSVWTAAVAESSHYAVRCVVATRRRGDLPRRTAPPKPAGSAAAIPERRDRDRGATGCSPGDVDGATSRFDTPPPASARDASPVQLESGGRVEGDLACQAARRAGGQCPTGNGSIDWLTAVPTSPTTAAASTRATPSPTSPATHWRGRPQPRHQRRAQDARGDDAAMATPHSPFVVRWDRR